MHNISSSAVTAAKLCGVFVGNTAAWQSYGESMWTDMMQVLRARPVHLRVLGVDSEWFRKSPLAVVQFATSSHCFVLHLSYFDGRLLPDAVKEALCDPGIIKCGVGVNGDVTRLQNEQRIGVQSVLDVAQYSVLYGLHSAAQSNLKVLAESVVKLSIEKNEYITRSNWELPLSPPQIDYCAEDALASYLVGEAVMTKAAETTDMAAATFNLPQWLKRTAPLAAAALKKVQREAAQAAAEKMKQAAGDGSPAAGSAALQQCGGGAKVRVLDKAGNFMFECSPGRAKFYVMEKSLAVITKHVKNNPRKATEIQLLFDPKVKTRLCMYDTLGGCELGDHCPFAHGIDQLQPEAAALVSSATPSCVCCLGVKGLLRHAITPPSFRKFMPQPYRQPPDEDFLPLCGQCNSTVRHYYDEEMKRCYTEAEADSAGKLDLTAVVKCASYARLLQNEEKLSKIPAERRDALRQYIRENWRATYLQDFNPNFEIREPVEQDGAFLKRLSKIVPGDVRAKVTVAVLIGDDHEKAKQFNQRWRDFCFKSCCMLDKKSNAMSFEDWKAYRARNGDAPADDDDSGSPDDGDSADAE